MRLSLNELRRPWGCILTPSEWGNCCFFRASAHGNGAVSRFPGVTLDENGAIVDYDIEAQCHSVFANVRAIVEDAGSSWDQIVDVTVFLTNMQADFDRYNQIYAEYFRDNQPCRTTVEVGALPTRSRLN